MTGTDPYALAEAAGARLRELTGPVDFAVVLGSGWNGVVDELGAGDGFPMSELPGFAPPTAEGHRGRVHLAVAGPHRV
nr:purine-nucleoside phosphorylase [Sporichthya sp.]